MDKAKVLRIIAQGIEDGYAPPISIALFTNAPRILIGDHRDWRTWASAFGLERSNADYSSKHMPEGRESVTVAGNGVEIIYHRDAATLAGNPAVIS